jgi:hypothetical protein
MYAVRRAAVKSTRRSALVIRGKNLKISSGAIDAFAPPITQIARGQATGTLNEKKCFTGMWERGAENWNVKRFNPYHGRRPYFHGLTRDRGFEGPCSASYAGFTGINNGLCAQERSGGSGGHGQHWFFECVFRCPYRLSISSIFR